MPFVIKTFILVNIDIFHGRILTKNLSIGFDSENDIESPLSVSLSIKKFGIVVTEFDTMLFGSLLQNISIQLHTTKCSFFTSSFWALSI